MSSADASWLQRALRAWVQAMAARPRMALLGLTLLAAAGVWHAATYLTIDTEASNMLDANLRYRQNMQEYLSTFDQAKGSVALLVRARTAEAADTASLKLVTALQARQDLFDRVFAPTVNPYLRRHGLLFLSIDELDDVSRRLSEATPFLERMAADPSLKGLFRPLAGALEGGFETEVLTGLMRQLADSAETTLQGQPLPLSWAEVFRPNEAEVPIQRVITVVPAQDFRSLNPAKAAVAEIQRLWDSLQPSLGEPAQLAITGDVVLRSEELASVSAGIGLSTLLSLLLVAAILSFGLRAWQLVSAALLSLFLGLFLTLGFASVSVGELNLVSIAFAVLFIGLGIDFAIHLALSYQEARREGQDHGGALTGAVHEIGLALSLCAPTTALTFYAFVPTPFVGMAQLGVISGTGVFIAFVTAITVIPAWLSLFPPPVRRKRPTPPQRLGKFRRLSPPVAVLGLLAGFVAVPWLDEVRFDADPMNLRDPMSPSVQAFQLLFDDERTQPYTLEYVASDLGAAQRLAEAFKQLPEVGRTVTLASYVPTNQDIKLAELDFLAGQLAFVFQAEPDPTVDPAQKRAAVRRFLDALDARMGAGGDAAFRVQAERLAERLTALLAKDRLDAFETAVFTYWPDQLDSLQRQLSVGAVSLEDVPDSLRRLYLAPDGRARVQIYPAVAVQQDRARARFVEAVAARERDVTGPAVAVLSAGRYVSQSMVQATALAAVMAFALLWLALKRIGTVMLILVPLALAAVLTLALSVWIGMPFNFANVIVLPLLIGLGVDSGIHFVLRAQAGGDPFAAVNTSTPKAVLMSALTTMGSFGTLMLNEHRGTASMGVLLTIAIGFTLICTLVVLPGLWSLLNQRRRRPR
ncbi:MAG: MMPL family transporter [Rhodothalassiaceae bacterium]